MILITVLLISLIASTNGEDNACCTGNNVITENGTCYDGSKLKITNTTCDYRLMLGKDQFTIAKNGSLVELAGLDEFISQDRFCLAKYEVTGEDVSVVCFTDTAADGGVHFGKVMCSLISIIFLLITIFVFLLVPKLRDLQGKCILNSMIGLITAFISLSVVQLHSSFERPACLFWAFTLYFTFLVAFFWLNVVAINMWKKTVMPTLFQKTDNFWYVLYFVYGYGGPLIFLTSSIITHNLEGDHIKPGFGDGVCFLNAPLPMWTYFYGPIAVLLVMNLILFIWSTIVLWRDFSEHSPRIKNLKYKCLLTLKLCLIMGIPWLFEVISFTLTNVHRYLDYLWTLTDYLNTLQGVLIFMVLVLFRKKALRGLASNPRIGNKFPKSWQRLDDDECSDEEVLEETNSESAVQYRSPKI
ncbi:putative Secretin family 7 transmembrane receptor [Trypoxylus dichotomus]